MPPGLFPVFRREPAMMALLLSLGSTGAPGLGLTGHVSGQVSSLQAADAPVLSVNTGSESANLESSMPHDAEAATPEPPLPLAGWPWLAVPSLSLWLWWLLEHKAKRLRISSSQQTVDLSAVGLDSMAESYAQSQHDSSFHNSASPQPDLKDWVRLTPQSSGELQADWQISAARRLALRQQGGRRLVLRLHDATGLDLDQRDLNHQVVSAVQSYAQQYECSEQAQSLTLRLPAPNRDYIAELGYVTPDGRWLRLACSSPAAQLDLAQLARPEINRKASRLKASPPIELKLPVQQTRPRPQIRPQEPNGQSHRQARFWLEPLMLIAIAFLWVLTTALKLLTTSLAFCRALLSELLPDQRAKSQMPDGQGTG